jgi:hypothetical protein
VRGDDKTDNSSSLPGVSGPVPGTGMTEQYVRQVGRMVYLWAWPMVNLHNRHVAFQQVPEPGDRFWVFQLGGE